MFPSVIRSLSAEPQMKREGEEQNLTLSLLDLIATGSGINENKKANLKSWRSRHLMIF
jgi:hypothetical protein